MRKSPGMTMRPRRISLSKGRRFSMKASAREVNNERLAMPARQIDMLESWMLPKNVSQCSPRMMPTARACRVLERLMQRGARFETRSHAPIINAASAVRQSTKTDAGSEMS